MSSAKKLPVWQQVSVGLVLGALLIAWMSSRDDVADVPIASTSAEAPRTPADGDLPIATSPAEAASSLINNASEIPHAGAQGTMDPIPVRLFSGGKGIAACSDPDKVYSMSASINGFTSGELTRDGLVAAAVKYDCLALTTESAGDAIAHDANGMMLVRLAHIANLQDRSDQGEGLELWVDATYLRHRPSGQHMLAVWHMLRDQ